MISKLKNSIKFLIIKFYLKLRRILKKTFDKSSNTYFFLKKINYLILQFTIVGSIMEWFYQSRARDKKIFKIKLPKFKILKKNFSKRELKKFIKNLTVPNFNKACVTIIIPAYNNIQLTMNCLKSISLAKTKVKYKIILIDDCSNEIDIKPFYKIKNIKFIRNKKNIGYLLSNNLAAKEVNTKFIYFLNNDTLVSDYWLDELVDEFYRTPNVGAVGSKMCLSQTKIQEAGGEIRYDFSARNVGKFKNINILKYNFARETSYCSAASLLTITKIFKNRNYFDRRYAPSYCEDSDYCLYLISKGYKVIYQPFSKIIHLESQTSVNVSEQIKRNNIKLKKKWKKFKFIKDLDFRDDLNNFNKPKILLIEETFINPDNDAGSVTVYNFIMIFINLGFRVSVYLSTTTFLSNFCLNLMKKKIEFLDLTELNLNLNPINFDIIFIFRPSSYVFLKKIIDLNKINKNTKLIYYGHDLHYLRLEREFKINKKISTYYEAKNIKKIENEIFQNIDCIIVTSSNEINLIKKINSFSKVIKFPLMMKSAVTEKEFYERKNICFFGNFLHRPNVDAINFFASEIFPSLKKKIPGIQFHIYGSNIPKDLITKIQNLDKKIKVKGFAADLKEILNNYKINIVPLRYGAGIKGKIGISLISGLPSIASSIAVEDMDCKNFRDIIICDKKEEYIRNIVQLYSNKDLWQKIRNNAVKKFTEKFGFRENQDRVFKYLKHIKFSKINKIKKSSFDSFYQI